MAKKDERPPERGDLVQVEWVDIYEDPTGDPDDAELAFRTSIGYFWKKGGSKYGPPVTVTTTTIDDDKETVSGTSTSGFCVYPDSCIIRLKIIKRAHRAPRKKMEAQDEKVR